MEPTQQKRIPMEFEEANDNFRAIRLLYRLLEDDTLVLQSENSKDLVERARALLKSLLDFAVESVFEAHLKESKSPVATNISQSSVEYPTCSKMTAENDEKSQLQLLSKELPVFTKFSISDDGGTECEKLCRMGEKSSTMQQNSVHATNLSNGNGILLNTESSHNKQQHNDVDAFYGDDEHEKESLLMIDPKDSEQNEENNISLMSRIHEAQSNSNAVRQVELSDQMGDFSDDLVKTIKRIESRILAFQLCSNLVDSTKNSAGHHTTHEPANSDSPVRQSIDGASGSQLSSGKSLLEGHRLMNQKTCKPGYKGENSISVNAFEEPFFSGNELLSQSQMANKRHSLHTSVESAKSNDVPRQIATEKVSGGTWLRSWNRIQNSEQNIAMIDRVKSLNRLVSSDAYFGSQASECIQGLRVPLNQDNHSKKHSMLASKTNRESLVRKNLVAWPKTDQNRKEMGSESSYAQKLAGSKSVIARREKPPLHQMMMKPTLLDQRSSEIKINSHQHRDSLALERRRTLNTDHLEPRKTKVLPQHQELEELRSNSDSSRRSSQQGSANSSSHSEDYSLTGSSSGRMVDEAYEGSSEESNNSYIEKDDGHSHRFGSFKSYRHHRERNPKETIGRLRRMKNKMGLVFHHHHHHHHHHDDDHGNTHSRAGQRHSMWNQLQSVFHHKDKHGVRTKKVGKTRSGGVARVLPQKNQIGQFHRLVEGVLSHIRHSKKPKPSRLDGVKQSRNTPHEHSQKKLGWWQILRPHRGVKLKNKGRVKMGFMSQKSIKNC